MRVLAKRHRKSIILLGVLLALVGGLIFTPLGYWLGLGVGNLVRGIADLPGVAWLRGQMAEDASSGQGLSSNPQMEAIDDILRAGQLLQKEEEYAGALERYREALEQDETYAPTYVALASAYMQLGQEDKAVEALEKAAELAPDNTFVLSQLGQLYLQREELEKGVDALERVKALDPDDAVVRYWLGMAYHFRSFADAERSVVELEKAAELEPDRAEIRFHLALAYVRRDEGMDDQRAIHALLKTLELDPSQSEAYYYLGQLYLSAGESESAVSAWNKYVAESGDVETVEKVRALLKNIQEGTMP